MFCKYCGKEIPENTIFCPKCGRQIGSPGQQAGSPGQQTGNQGHPAGNTGQPAGSRGQIYGAGAGRPSGSSAPRINMVNDFCKSPLFLVFTIIVSAQFVFNAGSMGYSVLDFMQEAAIGFACVCCWFIYVNSLQNKGGKTGFYLLRVGIPIYLVVRVIVIIATMVVTARWTYGGWKALFIIIYLVTFVLCIVGYVGLFLTADDACQILDDKNVQWQVRTFALVFFIVIAAMAIFSDIVTMAGYGYWFTAYNIIGVIADIAAFAFAVVILFMIRKKNREIRR